MSKAVDGILIRCEDNPEVVRIKRTRQYNPDGTVSTTFGPVLEICFLNGWHQSTDFVVEDENFCTITLLIRLRSYTKIGLPTLDENGEPIQVAEEKKPFNIFDHLRF